jgi:hypothetical protein
MNEVVAYNQEYHVEHNYHQALYFDLLHEYIKLIVPDMTYDEEVIRFYYIPEIEISI